MIDKKLTNAARGHAYALGVLSGDIDVCKWVKAACQRHIDDLVRIGDADWPYVFEPQRAERVMQFVQLLKHVQGQWINKLIVLEPWQCFSYLCVYGWIEKSTGFRRFREVLEVVPRKNAKSTKLAANGLYHLTADGEGGAQVYTAATTKEQARVVFDTMRSMARLEFRLHFGARVMERDIVVENTFSSAKALSADGETKDGLNVSFVTMDELHAHKTRTLYDVIETSTGARTQPLLWSITTAGSNTAGIGYERQKYLESILNSTLHAHDGMGYKLTSGQHIDDRMWGIIYTADETDDPLDEKTWRKCNPNYGISVNPEKLAASAVRARVNQASMNAFKTKHLNIWVAASSAWMDMGKLLKCRDQNLTPESMRGKRCVGGLDGAFRQDVFSYAKVFEEDGVWSVLMRHYMPEDRVRAKGNEHFAQWADAGHLVTTPGAVLDIDAVRSDILDRDIHEYELAEIGFDPAQLTQFAGELQDEGIAMVEVRATVLSFSEPMKRLDDLIATGKFKYNCPVLEWMFGNVVARGDAKENIYPTKESADKKIDGVVATIIAATRLVGDSHESFRDAIEQPIWA